MKNHTTINTIPSSEHDIRIAGHTDIEKVCSILASAFTNDPVVNWLCGQPKVYRSLFYFEAEALYRHHGHVYINNEFTGAAMWLPAGVHAKPPFHWRSMIVFWQLTSNGGLKSLRRVGLLEKFMAERHPHEPHFYLRFIGTSLENQGRGIGSKLLKAGLSACDQQGMPAYLESSNENNNLLYERHGFAIIGEEDLPDGGPTIWFMHRNASDLKGKLC